VLRLSVAHLSMFGMSSIEVGGGSPAADFTSRLRDEVSMQATYIDILRRIRLSRIIC